MTTYPTREREDSLSQFDLPGIEFFDANSHRVADIESQLSALKANRER